MENPLTLETLGIELTDDERAAIVRHVPLGMLPCAVNTPDSLRVSDTMNALASSLALMLSQHEFDTILGIMDRIRYAYIMRNRPVATVIQFPSA